MFKIRLNQRKNVTPWITKIIKNVTQKKAKTILKILEKKAYLS